MVYSGEQNYKYSVGYRDDYHEIKLLHIIVSRTSTYVKIYDGETKWMYFSTEDNELLESYKGILNKISNVIKIELDCKRICNF